MSEKLIRELHSTLMDGLRGQNRRPGEIRNSQVHIGRPPRLVPPPAEKVPDLLHNLGEYLNQREPNGLRPLVRAFVAHYQFEAIHPFLDGNGRVGRLLLALTIKEWEGLSKQWLYMSAFFDANKDDYIRYLYEVSEDGNWHGWLLFCLPGVVEQAQDAIYRCEALLELQKDFRRRIQSIRGSNRLGAIVDKLFSNSVLQIPRVAEAFDVIYHTARRDVEKLVKLDILAETELGGVRTFLSPEILRITYE